MGTNESASGDADTVQERLRSLPSVRALIDLPALQPAAMTLGKSAITRAARDALDHARQVVMQDATTSAPTLESLTADILRLTAVQSRGSLVPVLNATGVIVHTNLGRAPIAAEALQAAVDVCQNYSTLEFDLDTGKRGSRHGHVRDLLRELCGVEDACVVNNNAAAVLLALSAIAANRDVIVSRGELVEIGGGFRVPDVMRQGGANVVEVGTTNRTHPRDFANAINADTGGVLKVHQSNFATVGFVRECSIAELREQIDASAFPSVPLMYDAGSGCLRSIAAAPKEHTIEQMIRDGADLVLFSGDKLLGGPQAGIIAGRADLVERCRQHPLMRAMRPDKMCLAALESTLRLWRDRPNAVPVRRMVQADRPTLQARAIRVSDKIRSEVRRAGGTISVVDTTGKIGGGTSPLVELESAALCITLPRIEALSTTLRELQLPVIGRVEGDAFFVDFLTVAPDDDEKLTDQLTVALSISPSPQGAA